jgi:hypothetical protein
MRCPQSRPATISCRQTMAMSKPSGGVTAGIGAAGGAGERIKTFRSLMRTINARPQSMRAGEQFI